MAYTVPDLPYAFDALEPHIDKADDGDPPRPPSPAYVTRSTKRWRARAAELPIEELLRELDSVPEDKRTAVRNNGGGHYNHRLFWASLSRDGGGEPGGELATRSTRRSALSRTSRPSSRRRRRPVRLGLGVARARRLGARDPAPPTRTTRSRRQDAAAGRRRLGARLLPEVPEPPSGLHRCMVERRRLGRPSLRVTGDRAQHDETMAAAGEAPTRGAGAAPAPEAIRPGSKRRPGEEHLESSCSRAAAASSAAIRSGVSASSSSFSASHSRASAAAFSSRRTAYRPRSSGRSP